jgi:hypothetical protein
MPPNVLVVFYSRRGETEKRALAAGVGAIQARANIRLRRLPDLAPPETIQADTEWRQNLERMNKDYIAPREVDAQWADLFILATPPDCPGEMEQYLGVAQPLLRGKLAAVLGPFANAAVRAGLTVVPRSPQEDECSYGRTASQRVTAK